MKERTDKTTEALQQLVAGGDRASDVLFPLLYHELHRVASSRLRAEPGQPTLQTTDLIHEAYLKLVDQDRAKWQDRAHFCAVAAEAMRRILVDRARGRNRVKRGSGVRPQTLLDSEAPGPDSDPFELIALDEALTRLQSLDERQARVVLLKFFGGLGVEETATVLGVSERTIKGDWRIARAWLRRELATMDGDSSESDASFETGPAEEDDVHEQ